MNIELFLEYQAAERNASLNTLEAYRRDLDHFTKWTTKPILVILKADVQEYIKYLF